MTARLVAALQREIASADVPATPDTSKIARRTEGSKVVPGLSYHWATYRPADMPHGLAFALVAQRADSLRVVEGADDWGRVVAGWAPRDSAEAREACIELARAAGGGRGSERLSEPLDRVSSEIAAMPGDLRQAASRTAKTHDVISSPSSPAQGWTVEMWIFRNRTDYAIPLQLRAPRRRGVSHTAHTSGIDPRLGMVSHSRDRR